MPQPHDVVVVGSYVQDLMFSCATFPTPGETALGAFATGCGGKGFNQAIASSRAGASTLFVGALGQDTFGEAATEFAAEEGLAVKLAVKKASATGTAAIVVNAKGENQIVVAPGANAFLSRADLPSASVRKAKVIVAQLESNLATTEHVLRAAWDRSVITVLNPAPMRPDFPTRILRFVDILIPNETEFSQLAEAAGLGKKAAIDPAKLAKRAPKRLHELCQRLGPPTVIVTLGKEGAFISHPQGFSLVKPLKGVKAVDTTGAGDAFVGGFAAGLVHYSGDIKEAARYATVVAGLSVTKPGTAMSMPTLPEIKARLKPRKAR